MKRRYSDKQRAEALAALAAVGGDYSKASRTTGVPRTTLMLWAQDATPPDGVSEIRQEKKQELADLFEDVVRRILGVLTEDKLAESPAANLLTAAGIGTDKMLLLRGKPTSIEERWTMDVREKMHEVLDQIEKASEKVRA